MKKTRNINIAIVGLGNIGSYLYKYLHTNKNILAKKNNCIPNVIYVSAKNKKKIVVLQYLKRNGLKIT